MVSEVRREEDGQAYQGRYALAAKAVSDSRNQSTSSGRVTAPRVNINTASAAELEKLPGIGKAFAQRIVEYREAHGPFRRPEHLIMLRGMSDKRFRQLRDLVTVE